MTHWIPKRVPGTFMHTTLNKQRHNRPCGLDSLHYVPLACALGVMAIYLGEDCEYGSGL